MLNSAKRCHSDVCHFLSLLFIQINGTFPVVPIQSPEYFGAIGTGEECKAGYFSVATSTKMTQVHLRLLVGFNKVTYLFLRHVVDNEVSPIPPMYSTQLY